MLVPIISPYLESGLAEHAVWFLRKAEAVIDLPHSIRVSIITAETCGVKIENGKPFDMAAGLNYCGNGTYPPCVNISCPWTVNNKRNRTRLEYKLAHELWHLEQVVATGKHHERDWRRRQREMRERILNAK